MMFHGDIGTQRGLLMNPDTFRKHLKPAYTRMFQTCREAGTHVKYSSDGNLLDIVDDLTECGVSYHDPQVAACGIAEVFLSAANVPRPTPEPARAPRKPWPAKRVSRTCVNVAVPVA